MPLFPASAELGRASGLSKRFVCVRSLVSRLSAVRNPGSPWVSCVGIDRAAIGRPPCRPGPSGPSGPQPPAGKVFLSAIDPAESAGRSLRRRRRASRRSALAAPSQAPARVLHGRREVTAGRICCVSRFVKPVRQDRAGRSFAPRWPAARVPQVRSRSSFAGCGRVLRGRCEVTAGRICRVSRFVKPVRQDRAGRSFAPRRPAARVCFCIRSGGLSQAAARAEYPRSVPCSPSDFESRICSFDKEPQRAAIFPGRKAAPRAARKHARPLGCGLALRRFRCR